MHFTFIHFNYPRQNSKSMIYNAIENKNIKISIVQRNDKQFVQGNLHFVKDEFDHDLMWWQNSDTLNNYIGNLNPDIIYIFGLNLPLHFRWLKHYISSNTVIIAQNCGEDIWIQRNLWLQQSALRVVDGFVFSSKKDANPWIKCAAILDSQPIFDIANFKINIIEIYNKLLKNKLELK